MEISSFTSFDALNLFADRAFKAIPRRMPLQNSFRTTLKFENKSNQKSPKKVSRII